MRDIDALFESLVNIDRNSLTAILSSEAEDAGCLARSIRPRSASQRRRQLEAVERAARLARILSFVRDGQIPSDMTEDDIRICKSVEQMLHKRD